MRRVAPCDETLCVTSVLCMQVNKLPLSADDHAARPPSSMHSSLLAGCKLPPNRQPIAPPELMLRQMFASGRSLTTRLPALHRVSQKGCRAMLHVDAATAERMKTLKVTLLATLSTCRSRVSYMQVNMPINTAGPPSHQQLY